MERADSLAFDLHKWMHIPFEAKCVLVRSEAAHRRAFVPVSVGALAPRVKRPESLLPK